MSEWSIQDELCKLTNADSIESALRLSNVIDPGEVFLGCREVESWTRGGAETYIYRFNVSTQSREIALILKALTPPPYGVSIEKTVEQWNVRRHLLAAHWVPVPQLFCAGSGVILEEFIPYDLKEILGDREKIGSKALLNGLLIDLVRYAKALDDLGFACIDPFGDLRSNGQQVFVIDFGQDLGPAGVNMGSKDAERKLEAWAISQNGGLALIDPILRCWIDQEPKSVEGEKGLVSTNGGIGPTKA